MNVRSWLRRVPQPAKIRLDGKKVVRVGEGKNKWRDVVDVILTDHPHIVEALDSEGDVIRVTELEADGSESSQDARDEQSKGSTELAQIAAIIKESWLEAAKANQAQYEGIIAKYTELAQLVVNRNVQLETTVEKTWEEKAAEIASGNGDLAGIMNGPLGVLINAVMGRMLEGKKPEPAEQKNGKRARK